MEQLGIKHLGRRLSFNVAFYENGKPEIIVGLKAGRIYIEDCHKSGYCNINDIKTLILYPLSNLNQETFVNGQNIIPTTILHKLYGHYSFGGDFASSKPTMFINGVWVETSKWPYEIIEQLLSWHFHIDEPEGTWIDVNTLPKNPYE